MLTHASTHTSNFFRKSTIHISFIEPEHCCPILRLSSTNDETTEFWDTKLGSYHYHSLDNNGSAVYKHASEKDTYLFRSPTGNWMVSVLILLHRLFVPYTIFSQFIYLLSRILPYSLIRLDLK